MGIFADEILAANHSVCKYFLAIVSARSLNCPRFDLVSGNTLTKKFFSHELRNRSLEKNRLAG